MREQLTDALGAIAISDLCDRVLESLSALDQELSEKDAAAVYTAVIAAYQRGRGDSVAVLAGWMQGLLADAGVDLEVEITPQGLALKPPSE